MDLELDLPISDEACVVLRPDRLGAVLALVEGLQRQGRIDDAVAWLQKLEAERPGDPLVQVSLADLRDDAG